MTALVESPVVYEGSFDEAFLAVPQECLILTMQQHQKYFPAASTRAGKLLNRFLIVSNIETADPQHIIARQRARAARAPVGRQVLLRPGPQDPAGRPRPAPRQRSSITTSSAASSSACSASSCSPARSRAKLGADAPQAERAAWLAKADLLTDMVGEFPELQGIMGRYYALHDGEPAAVARAIEAHYRPRFAGDTLPEDNIGCAVALADKLDTLAGIFGIGQQPTGDKDPFGLRRQALGVLRILSEKSLPLDLVELLQLAKLNFAPGVLHDSVAVDLHAFMLERLRNYLRERGFAPDEIEAVVSQNPTRIDQVVPRLEAVQSLPRAARGGEPGERQQAHPQYPARRPRSTQTEPDPAVLQEAAEKDLYRGHAQLLPPYQLAMGEAGLHRGAAHAGRRAQGGGYLLRRGHGDDRRARSSATTGWPCCAARSA